jgi:TonB family protein
VPASADKTLLRLVTGLPDGVGDDLLKIEPCKSPSSRYSVAILEFRSDGAPRRVRPRLVAAGAACERVANALFLMSRAPDDVADPTADNAAYLALLLPRAVACTDVPVPMARPSAEDQEVVRVRGKVEAPKLESRVEPRYPEDARKRHEQGVSIYEAIITTTGCVTNLRLLKSSTPELDMMGMEAVAQWRYRPAHLNGRAVRVYLTVTITYRLN